MVSLLKDSGPVSGSSDFSGFSAKFQRLSGEAALLLCGSSLFTAPKASRRLAEMASATLTGRMRPTKPKKQVRGQKRKRDDVDTEVGKFTASPQM